MNWTIDMGSSIEDNIYMVRLSIIVAAVYQKANKLTANFTPKKQEDEKRIQKYSRCSRQTRISKRLENSEAISIQSVKTRSQAFEDIEALRLAS